MSTTRVLLTKLVCSTVCRVTMGIEVRKNDMDTTRSMMVRRRLAAVAFEWAPPLAFDLHLAWLLLLLVCELSWVDDELRPLLRHWLADKCVSSISLELRRERSATLGGAMFIDELVLSVFGLKLAAWSCCVCRRRDDDDDDWHNMLSKHSPPPPPLGCSLRLYELTTSASISDAGPLLLLTESCCCCCCSFCCCFLSRWMLAFLLFSFSMFLEALSRLCTISMLKMMRSERGTNE